tara:strand:+ start:938 stop:1645 length:708 start_codon:yes stop_codon:yes gene_type:complete
MIHKISFKGYSSQIPFKLIYLADEVGMSDLVEMYPFLLMAPISNSDTKGVEKSTVIEWLANHYESKLDTLTSRERPKIWQYNTKEREVEYKEMFDKYNSKYEDLEKRGKEAVESLKEKLQDSQYIIVPIVVKGLGMAYQYLEHLVNRNFKLVKDIRRSEKAVAKYANWSWSTYYVTSERKTLKCLSEWISEFKLVRRGSVAGMPCSVCPRAFHQMEGNCGFGGKECTSNLVKALK